MSELKINKNIILPSLNNIKDLESKRVMQEISNAIQGLNQIVYNDLTLLDERVGDLEET